MLILKSSSHSRVNSCYQILHKYHSASNASANAPSTTEKIIKLRPGLILIENALTPAQQINLALTTIKLGERPQKGFWRIDSNGQPQFNSQPYRGRMYDPLALNPQLERLCAKSLDAAESVDASIINKLPTHVITLCYQTIMHPPVAGYIPWHIDNGQNDGLKEYPIISFSLGKKCDFLLRPFGQLPLRDEKNVNEELKISLHSGSSLIMYGECRHAWHTIKVIELDSPSPLYLPEFLRDKRLNFTCRFTPHLIGREEEFITKSAEELRVLKDNPFYDLSKMKL